MNHLNPKFLFVHFNREYTTDSFSFRVMAYTEGSRSTFCLQADGSWVENPEMQTLPDPTFRINGQAAKMLMKALQDGASEVETAVEWKAAP